jgi:hypothetical protein
VKVRFETADLRCLASVLQPCFRDKAANGIKSRSAGLPSMLPPVPTSTRPTVLQLARAQTFRFLTMLATWALIFTAFIYKPGWIRDSLRFMTHLIETLADQVPEPWGARLEIILRELGGMIWIQIATAIVLLRLIVWVPFHIWRLRRERRPALSSSLTRAPRPYDP